jgi:DNA replication and repair protein RecF
MQLQKIKLLNFKNYEDEQFVFNHKLIAISGNNGVGKTNLLDAIYYSCLGKSHATASDKNVARQSTDFFRLEASFIDNDVACKIVLKVKPGHVKEIEVDNMKITKLSEHIGKVPIVMISPDDVHLLLQGNEERRAFFNNIIVQYDKSYIDHLALYNRLLKQRNALLKDFQDKKYYDYDLLWILTQRMETPAKYINQKRRLLAEQLLPFFYQNYNSISEGKEACDLSYVSQLDTGDFLHLSDYALEKDRATGRTSIGIHKDEILFAINDQPLKEYGSQGQLKTFIFALKLSQLNILSANTNSKPILLLDDIFDKLDPSRVQHLIELIQSDSFGQVFITDTHKGRVEQILNTNGICDVFEIHEGKAIQ